MRLQQEIVLGIGGSRALEKLRLWPTIRHINEGHAAFVSLEKIRRLVQEEHLTFAEAREGATSGNVFTTHTPVPAGIDVFTPELLWKYFAALRHRARHHLRRVLRSRPRGRGPGPGALLDGGPRDAALDAPERRLEAARRGLAAALARCDAGSAALGGPDRPDHQRRARARPGPRPRSSRTGVVETPEAVDRTELWQGTRPCARGSSRRAGKSSPRRSSSGAPARKRSPRPRRSWIPRP